MPSLADLRQGRPAAWTDFFALHNESLRAIIAWPRWHFDAHTREDVLQSVRAAITQSIARLNSEEALPAFVRRLCVNRCVDAFRRHYRDNLRMLSLGHWNDKGEWEEAEIAADDADDPVTILQREERAVILRAALAKLEPEVRDVLLQFYVEGLSYRQMAERQGVTVNTVGSRLSRGLDKLRELLVRGGFDGE